MKSWKTTTAGLIAAIVPMLTQIQYWLDDDPLTSPDWKIVTAGIAIGAGFFFARDNSITSEKAGAK